MPSHEQVVTVIREWVQRAESDLKTARHTLKLGKECPADTVCFHAQQVVEKYLKAVLVAEGMDFPRTHDIERVMALLPKRLRPSVSIEEARRLTAYATVMRYPGNYQPVTVQEARLAVGLARRVRKEIREILPKAALRGIQPGNRG